MTTVYIKQNGTKVTVEVTEEMAEQLKECRREVWRNFWHNNCRAKNIISSCIAY